jgi:hypothetical protein
VSSQSGPPVKAPQTFGRRKGASSRELPRFDQQSLAASEAVLTTKAYLAGYVTSLEHVLASEAHRRAATAVALAER